MLSGDCRPCERELLRCGGRRGDGRAAVVPRQRVRPPLGVALRRLFAHVRSAVHHDLGLPACPRGGGPKHGAVLPPALQARRAAVRRLHGALQHAPRAVGPARHRGHVARPFAHPAELPLAGRASVVHVPASEPLSLHADYLSVAGARLGPRGALLPAAVPALDLHALPAPLVRGSGGSASGTNTTCCGTSRDTSATWSWRIISGSASPGAVARALRPERR